MGAAQGKPAASEEQAASELPVVEHVAPDHTKPQEEDLQKSEEVPPESEHAPDVAEDKQDEALVQTEQAAPEAPTEEKESDEQTEVEASEEQDGEVVEEEKEPPKPQLELKTAPFDIRFPTTNQTKHCYTRYNEFHKCQKERGEGAPECEKYRRYYRSLCPMEWIEKWNEEREQGNYPGPY